MRDEPEQAPEPRRRWRLGVASRLVAAALSGVADVLDDRRREEPPDVEEAPDPPDGRWLVLLDREDPARSLIIVPHQVVTATGALTHGAAADPGPPVVPVVDSAERSSRDG